MQRKKFRRIVLMVMDSVGIGELPDAAKYGDQGSNTLGNTAKVVGGLPLPHLESLGLGRLVNLAKPANPKLIGSFGKMAELSNGKDTTAGHWEMAGLVVTQAFPTCPQGFPSSLLRK